MNPKLSSLLKIIGSFAEYYGKNLSENQIAMYVEDLQSVSPEALDTAVKQYRRNPKNVFFPLPAQLLEIISAQDGRPGVDEAWAMVPRDERDSVVWTEEIAIAWGVALPLLAENNRAAAHMAFREKYTKLVAEARANGSRPKWTLSPGWDTSGRLSAVETAVSAGRITAERACLILPDYADKRGGQVRHLEFNSLLKQIADRSFAQNKFNG
jgi:hypothetical protein